MRPTAAYWLPLLAGAALSACSRHAPAPAPLPSLPDRPAATPGANGATPSAKRAPFIRGFTADSTTLDAFRRACPRLLKRTDQSGLTRPQDWSPACSDSGQDATAFFQRHFTPVQLANGQGLATGYFEPEIAGLRTPRPGAVPVLARPPELVDLNLRAWGMEGGTLRGLVQGNQIVRAPDRAAIEAGAFAGRGLELAWAADAVDYFFLQIQGSGKLRMPDGQVLRIGYAGQNGHDYVAIGRLLKARGLMEKPGMAEIKGWIRANPQDGAALMRENPSYIFMQGQPDGIDGPIGSLGVPLLALANVAADPATLPLGVPVWIETTVDGQALRRLSVASDTGGAIKGPNRFDIFFGAGDEAARKAGSLAAPLNARLLLPKAAAERLAQ